MAQARKNQTHFPLDAEVRQIAADRFHVRDFGIEHDRGRFDRDVGRFDAIQPLQGGPGDSGSYEAGQPSDREPDLPEARFKVSRLRDIDAEWLEKALQKHRPIARMGKWEEDVKAEAGAAYECHSRAHTGVRMDERGNPSALPGRAPPYGPAMGHRRMRAARMLRESQFPQHQETASPACHNLPCGSVGL